MKTNHCMPLGDELPKEIERCQELLAAYTEIGPAGKFAAMLIRGDIARAVKALSEGNVMEMLRAYESLKTYN